jgi:hypothetical protein
MAWARDARKSQIQPAMFSELHGTVKQGWLEQYFAWGVSCCIRQPFTIVYYRIHLENFKITQITQKWRYCPQGVTFSRGRSFTIVLTSKTSKSLKSPRSHDVLLPVPLLLSLKTSTMAHDWASWLLQQIIHIHDWTGRFSFWIKN